MLHGAFQDQHRSQAAWMSIAAEGAPCKRLSGSRVTDCRRAALSLGRAGAMDGPSASHSHGHGHGQGSKPRFESGPARSGTWADLEASYSGGAEHSRPLVEEGPGVVEEIKEQVSRLEDLVIKQQGVIQGQRREIEELKREREVTKPGDKSPLEAQPMSIGDRRLLGMFDARFHSLHVGATPPDYRVLPDRIILVRHAESEGNINKHIYSVVPDRKLPLTERGWQQAENAGKRLRTAMERSSTDYKIFFFISPYRRSYQTYEGIRKAFDDERVVGACEEVQLREQDFGNFQDPGGKKKELAERLEFGRFFYRFPNGESGADVYDRITIFEDHLVRDINAGRFAQGNVNLVLVTHGLALRIILMRWFQWTVDQFLTVYNPPNAEPIILERVPPPAADMESWVHTKMLYRMSKESLGILRGCSEDMVKPCGP